MGKSALVFACDTYGRGDGVPGYGAGTVNYLPGAVRSARGLAVLLDKRGYKPIELYNNRCTKPEVLAGLKECYARSTGMGDSLVIAYVGHGLRVTSGGVLVDCLVLQDALPTDGSNHPEQMIPPSQWAAQLHLRPSHAHTFTNIDCCYGSGAAVRAPLGAHAEASGVRVVQPPTGLPSDVGTFSDFGDAPAADPGAPLHAPAASNLSEFFPCGPTELSVEQTFGNPPQWYSLWTYLLLKALQVPAVANGTYAQVFAHCRTQAQVAYHGATPVMTGDAALLGKRFLS